LGHLQEGADSFDGGGARLPSIAQVEYEAGIANGVATEPGWCSLAPIQELLNFTK